MKWLESAQSSWDAVESRCEADGNVWAIDAVAAVYPLSVRWSALAFALHEDDVWSASRRNMVDRYLKGEPGSRPASQTGWFRHDLLKAAEAAARAAGDETVAEWHVAQAMTEAYSGDNGLRSFGIDPGRLVERVKERERDNAVLVPPRPKPDWGTRWQRMRGLGEGGQAKTYVVRDLDDPAGREYALKALKNSKRIDRFRKEIEAVQRVQHRNVIELVEFDVEARRPYLVMPYCRRGSLAEVPAWQRRSPEYAVEVMLDVAKGLVAAHTAGAVHRDIKPENILLADDGHAIVADFGIAFLDEDDRVTTTFEVAASRWFGAPEMEHGRVDTVTPAADVYSLGKLLQWMFTDRPMAREDFEEDDWNVALVIGARIGEHVNRFCAKPSSVGRRTD